MRGGPVRGGREPALPGVGREDAEGAGKPHGVGAVLRAELPEDGADVGSGPPCVLSPSAAAICLS